MWKDFFYYSRSERRVILLLLGMLVILGISWLICHKVYKPVEKSEYAVTANDLKNKSDIPILLFLACTGYQ